MRDDIRALAAAALVLVLLAPPASADDATPKTRTLGRASVHFEQNATDGDVEVVFRARGRRDGLAKLTIVGPDGRKVVDFAAPDASTLGMRELEFESPEPPDPDKIMAAYPEGAYAFRATTHGGEELRSTATLSHALPATVEFIHPAAHASGVSASELQLRWKPVDGAVAYKIELESDALGLTLHTTLSGSASTLDVPDDFLAPGTEYQLGIGSVSPLGNVSFVETEFTTAE